MDPILNLLQIVAVSRVLFLYPHPDDETYANAALIKRLTQNNIETRVVSLTSGEASTLMFGVNEEPLSNIRANEFKIVMNFLGVSNYEILSFEDGNLENENLSKITLDEINNFKPTHIVTYEPWGIYGHPDHVALSKTITELNQTNDFILVYSTVAESYKPSSDTLKMSKDPSLVDPIDPNVTLKLSLSEYINKIRALRMYSSQVNIKHNFLNNLRHMFYLTKEHYHLKS